jgi:hypothetical protein
VCDARGGQINGQTDLCLVGAKVQRAVADEPVGFGPETDRRGESTDGYAVQKRYSTYQSVEKRVSENTLVKVIHDMRTSASSEGYDVPEGRAALAGTPPSI